MIRSRNARLGEHGQAGELPPFVLHDHGWEVENRTNEKPPRACKSSGQVTSVQEELSIADGLGRAHSVFGMPCPIPTSLERVGGGGGGEGWEEGELQGHIPFRSI